MQYILPKKAYVAEVFQRRHDNEERAFAASGKASRGSLKPSDPRAYAETLIDELQRQINDFKRDREMSYPDTIDPPSFKAERFFNTKTARSMATVRVKLPPRLRVSIAASTVSLTLDLEFFIEMLPL